MISRWLLLPALGPGSTGEPFDDGGWTTGPARVTLGAEGPSLALGPDHLFADQETAEMLLEAVGNPPTGFEIGLLTGRVGSAPWYLVFDHDPVGWIDDQEIQPLNAGALLNVIGSATGGGNRFRRRMSLPQLTVTRWVEAPRHDPIHHRLTWAYLTVDESDRECVNYVVKILTRVGTLSATLVTDTSGFVQARALADGMLAKLDMAPGNAWDDYDVGDVRYPYGLSSLLVTSGDVIGARAAFPTSLF